MYSAVQVIFLGLQLFILFNISINRTNISWLWNNLSDSAQNAREELVWQDRQQIITF